MNFAAKLLQFIELPLLFIHQQLHPVSQLLDVVAQRLDFAVDFLVESVEPRVEPGDGGGAVDAQQFDLRFEIRPQHCGGGLDRGDQIPLGLSEVLFGGELLAIVLEKVGQPRGDGLLKADFAQRAEDVGSVHDHERSIGARRQLSATTRRSTCSGGV